jgi:hypothetical protein
MKDWGAVIDTGSRVLTLKDPQGEVLSKYHCLGEQTL